MFERSWLSPVPTTGASIEASIKDMVFGNVTFNESVTEPPGGKAPLPDDPFDRDWAGPPGWHWDYYRDESQDIIYPWPDAGVAHSQGSRLIACGSVMFAVATVILLVVVIQAWKERSAREKLVKSFLEAGKMRG
jgi:hypothetical protein